MRRSPAAQVLSALLLFLYIGAQPATLCAVDCLLQRHSAHQAPHAGHHHETAPTQPCHTGDVGSATPLPSALTAVAAAPPDLALSLATTRDVVFDIAAPIQAPTTLSLALDPPPPRG
jgi:hypothetical protein